MCTVYSYALYEVPWKAEVFREEPQAARTLRGREAFRCTGLGVPLRETPQANPPGLVWVLGFKLKGSGSIDSRI